MNEVFFMEYQSNAKAKTIEERKTGSVLTGRNNKLVKHKLVYKNNSSVSISHMKKHFAYV